MLLDSKSIFQHYLKDFHKIKVLYLKHLLENCNDYKYLLSDIIFDDTSEEELISTIKIEMRLTYFHAIETFFELLFAFTPNDNKHLEDENVLYNLAKSDWRKNYLEIRHISENKESLNFLDKKFDYSGNIISTGHFIFYPGLVKKNQYSPQMWADIINSVESLKHAIQFFAKDFSNRDEYNSYKHGLRIVPTINKFIIATAPKMENLLEFDLSNSFSYYGRTEKNSIKVITKNLDWERDYKMTYLCSDLIHQMIFFRRMAFKFRDDEIRFASFPIKIFSKQCIDDAAKSNIDVQEISFTQSKQ